MKKLNKLITQQQRDQRSIRVRPIITNPTRAKVLGEIADEASRAMYILYKTDFSLRYIAGLFNAHHETVYRKILDCATLLNDNSIK